MNRPRVSVFVATSLDGFLARTDGSIDWLTKANECMPPGEDAGFQSFMDSVDALVMGRHTFAFAAALDGWPYGEKPVIVLSSREMPIPAHVPRTVSATSTPPEALLRDLGDRGIRHVYLDGGVTVQRFLAAGLVDRMTITVIPVILGAGKPLFGPVKHDVALQLRSSRTFPFGFVQLQYDVVNPAA